MAILASDIIDRAATVLNDAEHVRWPVTELIDWINDAASEVVIRRPQASIRTEAMTLAAGVNQALPDGAIQLVDVFRNVGGRGISRIDRALLDAQDPDWYLTKAGATIHFMLDVETPNQFFVYPPAKAQAQVEVKYSMAPPLVVQDTDTLELDRAYVGPLLSYTLYRAFSKDSEFADGSLAVAHFQAFNEALATANQMNVTVSEYAGTQ